MPDKIERPIGCSEMVLGKVKLVVLKYVSKELWEECIALNDPELRLISHALTGEIIARLSMRVFKRDEGEYEFEWYTTWWQELRSKILPKFWLRKFPSKKEVKKKVLCMATYPSLNLYGTKHKAVLQFWDR